MRTETIRLWQRPDERLPIYFDFTGKLLPGDALQTHQRTAYDIADDGKTDVAGTIVDSGTILGNKVALVIHQLTLGKTYHVEVQGETLNGQTLYMAKLLICGYQDIEKDILPSGGRESYLLNYESKIPAGVDIVQDDCVFTAYDETDLTVDLFDNLNAGDEVDGHLIDLRIENGEKGTTYVVHALAVTGTDPDTGSIYKAGKTLVLTCKEI